MSAEALARILADTAALEGCRLGAAGAQRFVQLLDRREIRRPLSALLPPGAQPVQHEAQGRAGVVETPADVLRGPRGAQALGRLRDRLAHRDPGRVVGGAFHHLERRFPGAHVVGQCRHAFPADGERGGCPARRSQPSNGSRAPAPAPRLRRAARRGCPHRRGGTRSAPSRSGRNVGWRASQKTWNTSSTTASIVRSTDWAGVAITVAVRTPPISRVELPVDGRVPPLATSTPGRPGIGENSGGGDGCRSRTVCSPSNSATGMADRVEARPRRARRRLVERANEREDVVRGLMATWNAGPPEAARAPASRPMRRRSYPRRRARASSAPPANATPIRSGSRPGSSGGPPARSRLLRRQGAYGSPAVVLDVQYVDLGVHVLRRSGGCQPRLAAPGEPVGPMGAVLRDRSRPAPSLEPLPSVEANRSSDTNLPERKPNRPTRSPSAARRRRRERRRDRVAGMREARLRGTRVHRFPRGSPGRRGSPARGCTCR